MLRHFIGLMSLSVALVPISVQAFPTSPQINKLAQRICQIPSQSPEAFKESMLQEMLQEMGGWMNQGSLSFEEMNNKDTLRQLGNEVAIEMYNICPSRVMELGNQYSSES